MTGTSLPTPQVLAITKPGRLVSGVPILADEVEIAAFRRDRSHYPLFAKPIDGKYSLSVISADDYDAAADCVVLQGGEAIGPAALATVMTSREAGYVIQRRLAQHPKLVRLFGLRTSPLVHARDRPGGLDGSLIHRAVAKVATG